MLQDRVQENTGMQGGSPSARTSSVKKAAIAGNAAIIFIVVLSLIGLYFLSNYSYLLFHNIVEIFSVAIAFSIFAIAWNTRRITDNNYFLFIGIALAFVASLSLIHTLAYKGMGVFPIYVEANLATQLWIATRYLLSFSFLLPLLFIQRKIKPVIIVAGYSIATSFLLVSIFIWQNFPVAYDITTSSLTNFKIISEYTIAAILLVSIGILIKKRREFSSQIYRLLVAAMALVIAAEMAFTLYTDVYGIANMVGHLLNVASFYLIYRALVETNLTKPYDILFRNLKQSEITLASRAEELTLANERLGKEIAERKAIEEELRESQGRLEEKAAEVKDYASQMEKLAQERARQLKDAERLSVIGATVGMVGHDICNLKRCQ